MNKNAGEVSIMITGENDFKTLYNALCEYSPVPAAEWDELKPQIRYRQMKPNEILVNVGEKPKDLHFIVSGLFRIYYTAETGAERTLVFRSKTNFIAAYSSFLKGTAADYTIQALEDSTLLSIPFNEYHQLLQERSCWNAIRQKYEQMLFIEQEEREKQFLISNAEERYLLFLKKYPGLIHRIPHYLIASYLGITPETLSRIRKRKN